MLFLFKWAPSLDQNIEVKKNFIETILVAMIEMWNLYWRAPKDKCNDNAMITLYQLKTNINAQLTKKAAFDALLRGLSMSWNEPPTSPLGVYIFWLLDSSCFFRSSEMWFEVIIFIKPYKHFISFHMSFWASSKLILTFTKWGKVACETTSICGPQCNVHLQNTTSIHRRQLLSTSASFRAWNCT